MDTVHFIHICSFGLCYLAIRIGYNQLISHFLNETRFNTVSAKGLIGIFFLYSLAYVQLPYFYVLTDLWSGGQGGTSAVSTDNSYSFYVASVAIYTITLILFICFIGLILESYDPHSLQKMLRHQTFAVTCMICMTVLTIVNVWGTAMGASLELWEKATVTAMLPCVPLLHGVLYKCSLVSFRTMSVHIEYSLVLTAAYVASKSYALVSPNDARFLNLILIIFPTLLFLQMYNWRGKYEVFLNTDLSVADFTRSYGDEIKSKGVSLEDVAQHYKSDTGNEPSLIDEDYIMILRNYQFLAMYRKHGIKCMLANVEQDYTVLSFAHYDYMAGVDYAEIP